MSKEILRANENRAFNNLKIVPDMRPEARQARKLLATKPSVGRKTDNDGKSGFSPFLILPVASLLGLSAKKHFKGSSSDFEKNHPVLATVANVNMSGIDHAMKFA